MNTKITYKRQNAPNTIRGRGAADNPPNRFEAVHLHPANQEGEVPRPPTELISDSSKSAITRNDSPDVGFEYSLNPYRGCEHGCVYCYARPTHEYLGFSAGLDFETRILVKHDAPELLRRELMSPKWRPKLIAMCGVTDPYQPVERELELTRRCLRVLSEFRNPVAIVTKNHLVTRDADLLADLAADGAAAVNLSITSLDPTLQRLMEPRASTPESRLAAIGELSRKGIPVGVMVAPVVPGLTDHEIPSILRAAAAAGATQAAYIFLRLPHGVKDLFGDWLLRHFPDRRDRVLNRVREGRDGDLYDSQFHTRMKGQGIYASHIQDLFENACRSAGLSRKRIELSSAAFKCPGRGRQKILFE